MCGITGAIFGDPALAIAPELLRRMTDMLTHRGPDDSGKYRSDFRLRPPYEPTPGVALGHRRLSIIDVAGGQQPLANEDKSIWLVFNGEIYNYRDLHQRLDGAGHTFRTRSDTETLVHLYEDEGPRFVEHLVGMFSLALWDAKRRRMILARDRLGQKPLYYKQETNRLLFASELKSILQVPGVEREIDASALDEYLTYQYVPHPNTIFRGIRKLPPAHVAIYQNGELNIERYWSPTASSTNRRLTEPEAREQLREVLGEAVRLRLQSEVPLGAFLSGGVDSSILVALMQQQSSDRVKTFCIGFAEPAYDESAAAAETAAFLGTEHESLIVEPQATDVLPRLVHHFDEPFADSSALPTWYLSEMTRRHVTVALSGDGGDELFLGYPRYRAAAIGARFDRLPRWLQKLVAAEFWQKLPSSANRKSRLHRLKKLLSALPLPAARRYVDWISIFRESHRAALYEDDYLAQLPNTDPVDFVAQVWQQAAATADGAVATADGAVATAGLADLQTYLPCDLMTKVDIASMAHSLECRQPFLDHRVVELAHSMPSKMKYRRGRGKQILQTTFGDQLPPAVFRRPKQGFGVPIGRWFREDLKEFAREILLDPQTTNRGYFRRTAVEELLNEHHSETADHGDRLWSLLFLELWFREWVD